VNAETTLPLYGAQVEVFEEKDLPTKHLFLIHGKDATIRFAAQTMQDAVKWCHAIQQAAIVASGGSLADVEVNKSEREEGPRTPLMKSPVRSHK